MALSSRLAFVDRPSVPFTTRQAEGRARVLARIADGTYAQEASACFCGDPDESMVVAERDRLGLAVRTVLCATCGLLRSTPRFDADSAARFFRDDFRDLHTPPTDAPARFASQLTQGRSIVRLLEPLLPEIRTVCEVGCGAGGRLSAFAENGKSVAGVDFGTEDLETGRRHGLDLVDGDTSVLLSRGQEPADLVLALHVVERCADLRSELARIRELVRPGGLLLVEVRGLATIASRYGGDILRYLESGHTFHFAGAQLRFVLESCGFAVRVCSENAAALCRRPLCDDDAMVGRAPPRTGAVENLRLLAALEQRYIAREHQERVLSGMLGPTAEHVVPANDPGPGLVRQL